jgi:26S proteasome regulatory subunit T3
MAAAAVMPLDSMQVDSPSPSSSTSRDDLYQQMKSLERQLEFVDLQEEYLKDEMRHLQRELLRAKEEIRRIQSVPLVIGQFNEMIDANYGIVSSTAGSNYYVRILSTLDREALKPNTSIALHRHSHSVVDILPPESDSTVQLMSEKPDVTYKDIGGMDVQKQEVREAIELPLIQHHLYTQIGIDPPRGVLLYGPPGTGESLWCGGEKNLFSFYVSCSDYIQISPGKTMMAKAVANATSATFISMVGSEFVQKYLGEGPRMVRDVFRLARENSPCVVFIDEIDAIATKRFDAQTGADREVQRILLELLNQMDGFDQTTNVKVIMATNRADTLDPALLRPGRLDRKIEFPQPDRRQKRMVFQAATSKMNLSDELDLEDYVNRSEKVSCADVSSICAEAGLQAVRENRYVVLPKDFDAAYKRAVSNREKELLFYSI